MRITAMEVRGESGAFVTMRRRDGSPYIECEVIKSYPGNICRCQCLANNEAEITSLATRLQLEADGRAGTSSEIFDWRNMLGRLGDI